MGFGDELMAAGHARRVSRETGKRVCITGAQGEVRNHELWEHLDFITPCRGPDVVPIVNGPGARPYIRYPFTAEGHGYTSWRARDHRPVIAPQLAQRAEGGGFILIEPGIKRLANPNKRWTRWQEVVDAFPGVSFVQLRAPDATERPLERVQVVQTSAFRQALAWLARASLYVGHEGGLHHAAAALDVPAVVVFGGSPSIEATGYPDHTNLGTSEPCGRWAPCAHCAEIMNAITPEQVIQAVKEKLQ